MLLPGKSSSRPQRYNVRYARLQTMLEDWRTVSLQEESATHSQGRDLSPGPLACSLTQEGGMGEGSPRGKNFRFLF